MRLKRKMTVVNRNINLSDYYHYLLFLYPPHRGYISFVNTFVIHRNNDLGPYVPWRHLISAKFDLCLSVRPSVRVSVCGKHDCVRTRRATDLKICTYYPYAGWY